MKKHISIGLFLVLVLAGAVRAQIYPVVSNMVMPFPHSPFLFDYYAPGAMGMQVTIQLNDFTVPSQRVKLQFEIENGSLGIRTTANYTPPGGITLTPGVAQTLSGSDLYDALNSNNLDFNGISEAAFNQSGGRLPEGQYNFCVKVLDYNSGKELSLPACANIFIQLEVPPVLITPECATFIQPAQPQNIRFSWQVAGQGQPSFFGLNTYILHVYQITDPEIADPLNAVLNSKAVKVFESQPISQNALNLDFSTVLLVPGNKYVTRVQGIGPEGKETFQNEGYSEWCWFTYGYQSDGVLDLQEPFDGKQFEKTDTRVFTWAASDKGMEGQPYDYQLTIVALDDTSQSLQDAMTNNAVFHQENLPTTSSQTGANFQLTKELDPDKKYAWKVTASSQGQLVAESEIRSFYSHSLIDYFYASNQKIKVVQTGNADLENFEGVARVQLSGDETDFIDVPFAGLKIQEVAGQMILKAGQITFPLDSRDRMDIDAELPVNGVGQFEYVSGLIDKTGLKVDGKIVWLLPHAVDPGAESEVTAKTSTFVMNSQGELSGEAAIEPFQTTLLAPKDFGLRLKPTSKLQLADNKLVLQVLGFVDLPPSVLTYDGAPVSVEIKDYQQTLDYIEIENLLSVVSGGIGPIQGLGLEYVPVSKGVIDLSEDKSPGKLAPQKTWKGFYVEDYKIRMNVAGFDPTNQITVPERLDQDQSLDGTSFRFWIGGSGLTLKSTFNFDGQDGLRFNSFQTETFQGEFDIKDSEFKNVMFRGTTKLPFIGDDDDFEFEIPTTEGGLETGFIETLDGLEFIYNPYGGENRMDFTINRAVFVDNTYLQLNCDIDCPELAILIEGQEDLRIYGDHLVGFSGRNTSVKLDDPILGRFKNLDVTATEIGASFLGSEYAVSLVMETYLSEGFTDTEGGPPTFSVSSVAATSAEAPAGTPLPAPEVEVPEDLAGEEEIKPTGFDVSIETPLLDAGAYLLFTGDDPTWGTRFSAGVNASLKVPARYNMGGNMTLGFVDGMDYWYFDVYFEDVDGEGVQVMVPYVGKITNIVGIEGQIFRHVKSKANEEGEFELALSPNTQFGANIFLQLIDPYAKGFIYQADLGLENEIQGEGYVVDNFEQILTGQASFLNMNFRTGAAADVGAVVEMADELGVADAILDQIFPQTFNMLGQDITLDSKGLNEGSSIEIGSVEGGEGLLLGAKVSSEPGLEIGAAYGGYKVYGKGDAGGNAKMDLEVAGLDLKAELIEKTKGSFSLSVGDLATSFSGDYGKKKGEISFDYDGLHFAAGGDKQQKSGFFDYAYDGKEVGAYANIPAKQGGLKLIYDDKRFQLDVDGTAKSAAFNLEYGDYIFRNHLNITEKSGSFYLETPIGLVDIAGSPTQAKFKAEVDDYLFHVQAEFPQKTGLLALKFPNHELRGELKTDRGSVFLRKDDFEIGLGAKYDATGGDLHVKEGDFIFDIGADIATTLGYLTLQNGNKRFDSRYSPSDTSFIKYASGPNLYEAVVGSDYYRARYKDSDYHFLLELNSSTFAGRTIFKLPDFEVSTDFDATNDKASGMIEVLGHKVNASIVSDSAALAYKGGDLDLRVSGKYGGGGSVYFADAGKNLATGFSYDHQAKAGSINFQKDGLAIDIAGNKSAGTGSLGFVLDDDHFNAGLGDSLYVDTEISGYGFAGMASSDKLGASFAWSDNRISVAKLSNGERLRLEMPSNTFALSRDGSDLAASYANDNLAIGVAVGSSLVGIDFQKDDLKISASADDSKKVDLNFKKAGYEVGIEGQLNTAVYTTSISKEGWTGTTTAALKGQKSLTLGLEKSGVKVEAGFAGAEKTISFTAGDFKVKGGVEQSTPIIDLDIADLNLDLGGLMAGDFSAAVPGAPAGIHLDHANAFSVDIGNLDAGSLPNFVVDLDGIEFKIDADMLNGACNFDLTRENNPIAILGNQFEETVNGHTLRLKLNPDDSKNVFVSTGDLTVDVTYTCGQLPAVSVEKAGKVYAFSLSRQGLGVQYDDQIVNYTAANHELEVKSGSDYRFLINDDSLDTDINGYELRAQHNRIYAGTGGTYIALGEDMVGIHADDKFVEVHDDNTFLLQVDPDKNIAVTPNSVDLNVDSKHLYLAHNDISASDTQEAFALDITENSLGITKDDYSVDVGPEGVRFEKGGDHVEVTGEALSAKYDDKQLRVSTDKEVSYKDNERELKATPKSLYLDYEGKIMEVDAGGVSLQLASDQKYVARKELLSVKYGQYQVDLGTPFETPSFAYSDNNLRIELADTGASVIYDGKGAIVGSDKLHVLFDENYLKYEDSDLNFKYGRYTADFTDWNSVHLSNGVQQFGISPNEIMAALDENNKVKVFLDKNNPGLELQQDETRFAINTEKAEFDYDGMHYALGKKEYIAVHEIGKPETGFVFTEDGIKYNFDQNNWIKAAPKGDFLRLQLDDKYAAFRDDYSLQFGVDDLTATIYKDLSIIFKKAEEHSIELNKDDYIAGYTYLPKDVYARVKRFDDNYIGLLAGMDKYAGFVKPAKDRSIEVGGIIDGLGQASVTVNADKDITGKLKNSDDNFLALSVEKAKTLKTVHIKLDAMDFFKYGGEVDVFGEDLPGVAAVGGDGPSHISILSEKAGGWAVGGLKFRRTIGTNFAFVAQGRIQTGLTLPMFCADAAFAAEIRAKKVRIKVGDKSDYVGFRLLCVPGLPPLFSEEGYADLGYEASGSGLAFDVGAGYRVRVGVEGGFSFKVALCEIAVSAGFEASLGFGGEASLTIPFESGTEPQLTLGPIFAEISANAYLSASACGYSIGVSAGIQGRLDLNGNLEGAKAQGQLSGHFSACGLSKSFDYNGSFEL